MIELPPIKNFSETRNKLLEMVQTEWILFLDADEIFDEKDIPTLVNMTEQVDKDTYAYNFFRYNYFYGGGWNTSKLTLRLFRNRPFIRFSGIVMESVFDSIMSSYPTGVQRAPIVLNHIGQLRSIEQRCEKCVKYNDFIKQELSLHPDRLYLQAYIGLNHRNQGNLNKALEYIESALERRTPDYICNPLLFYIYGHILKAMGQYEPAAGAYKQSLVYQKQDALVWNMLGVAYMEQNRLQQAQEALLAANKIEPILSHVLINIGLIYYKQALYRKALQYFLQAADETPYFIDPSLQISDVHKYDQYQNETITDFWGLPYYIKSCQQLIQDGK
jgi:tetratricopeptide (TPR) repeat protein